MRKLFFPLFISVILFFISGCQSESPVAPVQTNEGATLNKPGPIPITYEITAGTLYVSWDRVGGAKSYEIQYYWNAINGSGYILIATKTTTSERYCSFSYAPQASGYREEVMVIAYRKSGATKKGGVAEVLAP